MYIFALSATVLLTFQTTFLLVNDFWQKRVTDMVATDRTALSESLTSLDGIVKSKSVYAADTASLIDGAMGGYLSGLGDRYAMYMNSEQYSDYIAASAQGSSVGIGISSLYDSSKNGIYVVNVYADSPAQKAGIVPGDTITSVNGVAVNESGFYGAMLKIGSGEAYSSVLLKVRKSDGTSEDITVPRDIVSVNSVSTGIIHDTVGVISISEFTNTVTDDFKNGAEELIKNGADRFIIDIRNNPGGETDNVAALLDFILPDGTTITGTDRDGSAKVLLGRVKLCGGLGKLVVRAGCDFVIDSFELAEAEDVEKLTLVEDGRLCHDADIFGWKGRGSMISKEVGYSCSENDGFVYVGGHGWTDYRTDAHMTGYMNSTGSCEFMFRMQKESYFGSQPARAGYGYSVRIGCGNISLIEWNYGEKILVNYTLDDCGRFEHDVSVVAKGQKIAVSVDGKELFSYDIPMGNVSGRAGLRVTGECFGVQSMKITPV